MLKYLSKDIKYTLVVNSVTLAEELKYWDNVTVYVVGGVDANFGLSNGTDETATFQRTVIENTRKNILLMPKQKLDLNHLSRFVM